MGLPVRFGAPKARGGLYPALDGNTRRVGYGDQRGLLGRLGAAARTGEGAMCRASVAGAIALRWSMSRG
jgi:hypothetical protein